jgi:glycosyltransferase involved in cell wall biosynthesis
MELPRVLVISSDPFSKECANGRTLGSLFIGYPKDKLAQLYCNDYPLDMLDCRYFRLSDKMILSRFKTRGSLGEERQYADNNEDSESLEKKPEHKKNPFTCLIRDDMWRSCLSNSKKLDKWIDSFNPEIVLLQASDRPYEYDYARRLSKKRGVSLVIHNSEEYFFKKDSYFAKSDGASIFYPLWHKRIVSSFTKMMKQASTSIYLHSALLDAYKKAFPSSKGEVIMTSTLVKPGPYTPKDGKFKVIYFGNLASKRHESLIEIAKCLHSLTENYSFDVYGSIEKGAGKEELESCPYLSYHGLVSYKELRGLVKDTDLIVHAVSFDEDILHCHLLQFSTKIADCLASGRCFLVYAPKDLAFVKYLNENKACYVATSEENLKEELSLLINDPTSRNKYLASAASLVDKDHSEKKNAAKMQSILLDVIANEKVS